MNVSTTIPTTVQITRGHLIVLIVATAALAAVVTWALVAVAFDPSAATPAAVTSTETGQWPGPPPYPPNFRGMP